MRRKALHKGDRMQTVSEVTREHRREPLPLGWAWLRRLLRQPGWAAPVRPALDLNQLRRIAYL